MSTDPPYSAPISESPPKRWASPFEDLLQEVDEPDGLFGAANIQRLDPTIGSPQQDNLLFPGQQSYPDTCAIRCQEYILTQFWGYPIDEGALVREAKEQGWYTPGGGTQPQDVGNLLELHGVPVNRYYDATLFHLANRQEFLTLQDEPQQWDSLTHSPSLAAGPDPAGSTEEFTAELGPEDPVFEPEPSVGWESHSAGDPDPDDDDIDPA
jgi:hypothetical protein